MAFIEILTPFLLASIGGLYSELSGFTNVTLEGYISLGGFTFITLRLLTGSDIIALLLTLILIILVSFLQGFITIKIKANAIITGLATNMGLAGFISVLSYKLFNTKGVISLNILKEYTTLPFIVIALLLPGITYIILRYTVFGLRLKARGINKKVLIYSGVNNHFYRISGIIISAVLSGLAGVFLAMELRSFTPNLSGGRGWIALIIVFLGKKSPIGILISSIIFAGATMLSNIWQGSMIPQDIILAVPYILTLFALFLSRKS